MASESANKTVVTADGTIITDVDGQSWSIAGGVGQQYSEVTLNGIADASTFYVKELAYVDHTLWQENTAGDWYAWEGPGNGASAPGSGWGLGTTTSPLTLSVPPLLESTNDTVDTTNGPIIVDAHGQSWSITGGIGQQDSRVALNGAADSSTYYVKELAYVNHTLWQENTAGWWYSWNNPGWSSGTQTSPLTGVGPSAEYPSAAVWDSYFPHWPVVPYSVHDVTPALFSGSPTPSQLVALATAEATGSPAPFPSLQAQGLPGHANNFAAIDFGTLHVGDTVTRTFTAWAPPAGAGVFDDRIDVTLGQPDSGDLGNITSNELSGSGVTAQDFHLQRGQTETFSVTFTAKQVGALVGQDIHFGLKLAGVGAFYQPPQQDLAIFGNVVV
jgi:hypothetical protein